MTVTELQLQFQLCQVQQQLLSAQNDLLAYKMQDIQAQLSVLVAAPIPTDSASPTPPLVTDPGSAPASLPAY